MVTGYARDEAEGRAFVDLLLPEESRGASDAELHRISSDRSVELPLRTRAGKIRVISWQIARAPETEADDVAVFAIGMDVTDEKVARQRDQQQERLAAIGTLAAGLAHEIRNPLNGAQLHVSFLERSLEKSSRNDEMLDAVRVVDDEIKRLARLVTEFLDFARPRPLALAPVGIAALAERVTTLLAARAATSGVKIVRDLPSSDIPLVADRGKLEQVLLNLLQNGIEALTDRGGTVTLRARREPRHAVLEVEDDGPGLPVSGAPIFDAFFSTKPDGTGLGLAIVHRIVTDHGGVIDVESKPGRTCFRLKLQLDERGRTS